MKAKDEQVLAAALASATIEVRRPAGIARARKRRVTRDPIATARQTGKLKAKMSQDSVISALGRRRWPGWDSIGTAIALPSVMRLD